MKYLIIYEAFESSILTKTLSYVKGNKELFLNKLKGICDSIDYPYSNLSDEFFEYLPFKKALDAKSSADFEGLKLVKFWFDSEGNYICCTGFDGTSKSINSSFVGDYDLTPVKTFSSRSGFMSSISTGDYVMANIGSEGDETLCYVFKYDERTCYFLSNNSNCNGSDPGDDWRRIETVFGNPKYSWCVTLGGWDCEGYPYQVNPFPKDSDNYDSYTFNVALDDKFRVRNGSSVKDLLKVASFAIVFDIARIKSSEFTPRSVKTSDRSIRKSGAFITSDEFKKLNINRYVKKLYNDYKFDESDLSNIEVLLKRLFGFNKDNYFWFLYYSGVFKDLVEYLITILSKIWKTEKSGGDTRTYYNELNNNIKEYIDRHFRASSGISSCLSSLYSLSNENQKNFLNELNKLGPLLYDQIFKSKIEFIEDLVILSNKLSFFREQLRNNFDDYNFNKLCDNIYNNNPSISKQYLDRIGPSIFGSINKVNRIIVRV